MNLVPIYVDCTAKGQNGDLQSQYEVKGYPTVLYVDPTGKQIKESGTREAGALQGEINGVAKKFPGRPSMWFNSAKGAAATRKKVAVYVAKEDADPAKVTTLLTKNLGDRKTKLAWVWRTGTEKVLKELDVEKTPAVVIYTPNEKGDLDLLGKVTVTEGDDPKVLNDGIDEVLKTSKK
jgi:hypothetical protein